MTTGFTTSFRFQKPDFRSSGWGDQMNSNMDAIDSAILNALSSFNISAWTNNTAMLVGQTRIDTAASPVTYWTCAVAHTSATTPTTFATDRAAHPTFWNAITFALKPRGAWAHSTLYSVNDIAYDSTLGITGICKITHTSNTVGSGGTIQTDVANWDFIVNLPAVGVTAAVTISFNNAVAALSGSPTNVQTAIEALDASNDTQGTTIASHTSSIATINTTLNSIQTTNGVVQGYLFGLILSTAGASNTFSVAPGSCIDSTSAAYYALALAMSKTTAAWAAGTAVGGLDTGAIANNTWYHVFLILNPSTHAVDVVFSATSTPGNGPTVMPTGYTFYRRIGSIKTEGTAKWLRFFQSNDEFLWSQPINDLNAFASINGLSGITLTVPTGINTGAKFVFVAAYNSGAVQVLLSSPDLALLVNSNPALYHLFSASGVQVIGEYIIRTNTIGQINVSGTGTGTLYYINTLGWIDSRGKLS